MLRLNNDERMPGRLQGRLSDRAAVRALGMRPRVGRAQCFSAGEILICTEFHRVHCSNRYRGFAFDIKRDLIADFLDPDQ